MSDDELRSILHEEADSAEPGDHSWSRLESRLERASERSAPRAFALGTVAIAVAVSLVVGVVWLSRKDRHHSRATLSPSLRSMPGRILAMTTDRQPVVLDARTGKVRARYESHSYAAGTSIAVAPDGRDFYFAEGDRSKGCEHHSITRFPLPGGRPGAQVADEASEPAISPDGRYLAFYRCFGADATAGPRPERTRELVVRDLANRVDAASFLPPDPSERFGRALVFESDSHHLVYELVRTAPSAGHGTNRLYRFDPLGGEALPGQEFGLAPRAFRGTLGDSGSYVAVKGRDVLSLRCARCPDTSVFTADRLLRMPRAPHVIASDRTGDHLLLVSARTLYRWSEGDKKPTKIRDSIVAAAWIPDSPEQPRATPAPGAIVAVRSESVSDGRVVVLDSGTGAMQLVVPGITGTVVGISSSPDGSEIVVGSQPTGGTFCAGTMQGVKIPNGLVRPILGEAAAPVVNHYGLAAYGISCDGHTLGFTNLVNGENSRSNPLADVSSEASPRVEKVEPLGWSPDGTRLLYRLKLRGDVTIQYYAGSLWPAVPSKRTKVVPLPDDATVTAATFLDDRTLAVAERHGSHSVVRSRQFGRSGSRARSRVLFTTRGRVQSLVADLSGQHLLVVVDDVLYRWDRGNGAARKIADAVMAADWLGSD